MGDRLNSEAFRTGLPLQPKPKNLIAHGREPMFDVLALLGEVPETDAVTARSSDGSVLRTRSDVVCMEGKEGSNVWFQVAHIGNVSAEVVDNTCELTARIVDMRREFLLPQIEGSTIEGAYVGRRKSAPKDGEFPYFEPLYVDLRRQPVKERPLQ